jgi:hypothetical protein
MLRGKVLQTLKNKLSLTEMCVDAPQILVNTTPGYLLGPQREELSTPPTVLGDENPLFGLMNHHALPMISIILPSSTPGNGLAPDRSDEAFF